MARTLHSTEIGEVYHATTRTVQQAFHLVADADKLRVVEALRFYHQRGDFRLYAYVIMNNHLHIVLQPMQDSTLSEIMRDFKKWTSRHNRPKGDADALWERRYDDNQIASQTELRRIIEYIHQNPVRAGLVNKAEDYFWSSARNYAGIAPVALEVDTEWG